MSQDFPTRRARMEYVCMNCGHRHPVDALLYTCPDCGGVLLLEDLDFDDMKDRGAQYWRDLFDARRATRTTALRGVFRFYELMAPVLEEEDIVYLGEGDTPVIEASSALEKQVGRRFAYKNDGMNPSASFKDRGMAGAYSYLKSLVRKNGWKEVLTICASTGDTSAAAAMYGAYVGAPIRTVVLLPHGKVTPAQLSQPLGSGAQVLEVPGVFDDCMKVVEYLAEHYRVALLNSKNSWRVLGQESYAYEVAQWYGWDMSDKALFMPIGNAGNITSMISACLKMHRLGIIDRLPHIVGVQSEHADPVWRYYSQPRETREYHAVPVQPSVAQAAMIGNPVSFPRVKNLAAGRGKRKLPPPPEAFSGIVTHRIVSVSSKIIHVLRCLWKKHEVEYDRVFEDSREKSELVATFLAVLELVKGKRVRIEEESTTRKLKLLGGGGKVWRSRSTKQS